MIKSYKELLNNVEKWEKYLDSNDEKTIPTLYLLYKTLDIPPHIINQLYILKRNNFSKTDTCVSLNKGWRELAPQIIKIIDKLRINLAYYYEFRILNLNRSKDYINSNNNQFIIGYYNSHMKKYIEQWDAENTSLGNKIEITMEIKNDTPTIK